mmetsp:Transcript_107287/g.256144  ORF Transcript_107287/g.256144 Transcript_107287/m.256144 type:complete len:250 (+) Transcript_107287:166-915(+)
MVCSTYLAARMELRARAMCMRTTWRPTFGKRFARVAVRHRLEVEHRQSCGMAPYGSSGATPRRTGTTSMISSSSTSPRPIGPASIQGKSPRSAQTTPASSTRRASTSLEDLMAALDSRICTSSTRKIEIGFRCLRRTTCRLVALVTLPWSTSRACLSLAAGMAMIPWMTSTSSPSRPANGTACLVVGMCRRPGIGTARWCTAAPCSSSVVWISDRRGSLISASSALTHGPGRRSKQLGIRPLPEPSTVR